MSKNKPNFTLGTQAQETTTKQSYRPNYSLYDEYDAKEELYDQLLEQREERTRLAQEKAENEKPSYIWFDGISPNFGEELVGRLTENNSRPGGEYVGANGKKSDWSHQASQINARDAIQTGLLSSMGEFTRGIGSWLPQAQEAIEYLETKKKLVEELSDGGDVDVNIDEFKQLEQRVKEYARTNPHIMEIFYNVNFDKVLQAREMTRATVGQYDNIFTEQSDEQSDTDWLNELAEDQWAKNNDELDKLDYISSTAKIQAKIDKIKNALPDMQEEYDDKEADIKERQKNLTTPHMLHLFGVPTFYYDPDDIDPTFDEQRQKEDVSLLDPSTYKYGLTHLGSSLSEAQLMGATYAVGLAAKYGSKLIPYPGAWAIGEAGANILLTQAMRHRETAAEVMDAYSEKILNNEKLLADGEVFKDYDLGLKARGIDTSKMDDLELLQFGLAFNIPTSSKEYNEFARNARVGLTELEQGNNALAIGDYAENLGLSFGGRILSKNIKSSVKTAAKSGATNILANHGKLKKAVDGLRHRTGRLADKVISNPAKKVAVRRAVDAVKDFAWETTKRYGFELTEEGQQGVFNRRYQDRPVTPGQIEEPYSFFKGVIQSQTAGVEAIEAYYGLHPNDMYNTDENITHAMDIGGFIGAIMGGGFQSVSQFNRTRKQIKSDLSLTQLAADGYEKAENSLKVTTFLDSYRKGNNSERMRLSLEGLKKYKGEGVTDAMIDEDIDMAELVYSIYKNRAINPNLEDLNINRKKDDDFVKLVQNQVALVNRLKENNQLMSEAQDDLSAKKETLFSTDPNHPTNVFMRQEYDKYAKSTENPMSFEEWKTPLENTIVGRARGRVLDRLYRDIVDRKKTLEQINQEYGIDIDTRMLDGLAEYVKSQRTENQKVLKEVNDKLFHGTLDLFEDPASTEELEQLLGRMAVLDGIGQNIAVKNTAYATGRLPVRYRYLVQRKPLFNNLDSEEQSRVLDQYAQKWKEAHKTNEEPTRKQVVSYYNMLIQQEWNALEDDANVEQNERVLATEMMREDLRNTRRSQRIGQEENRQRFDIEPEEETTEPGETPAEEPILPEEPPTPVREPAVRDEVGNDNDDTAAEASTTNEPMDSASRDDSEPEAPVDEVTAETNVDDFLERVSDEKYTEHGINTDRRKSQNSAEEAETQEVRTEDPNSTDDAETQSVDDNAVEQDELKAKLNDVEKGKPLVDASNTLEQSNEESVPETANEEQTPVTETIEEEKKPVKPAVPKEGDRTVQINVEDYSGSSDIIVDVPINEGQEDISEASTENIQTQGEFDQYDALDLGTQAAVSRQEQQNTSPGLDTKKEVETNRIHSTLFYDFRAAEVMDIQANGKPVIFDGERRPGSELAEKLVEPGWLAKQKVYFIVTDSKETRKKERNAVDRLAVHMVIEETTEDGKTLIYNTALYQPDKAMAKMRQWGMPAQEMNEELNKLRKLRKSIINKFVEKYAPGYFENDNVHLPQTAQKGIVPVNLRQSNGSINSYKQEDGRPIYRPLTDVNTFGIESDPIAMTNQILNGEIEFGIGKGPFPMAPEDAFKIYHFDNATAASCQGIGYAGKIYLIPKIENTPSQRNSAPIMLAEKRHFIPGGSANLVLSYKFSGDNKAETNYDDKGKRIPLTSAELLFRLVTGTLPISGRDQVQLFDDILNILVRHGANTVNINNERADLAFYNRKTLYYFTNKDGGFLMYGERRDGGRSYKQKCVKIRDAGGNIVINDTQARDVIRQLSNNLHWNTDREAMMQPIPDSIVNAAIEYMNRYNTDYYRVLNCDDLTFTMEDLNLKREKGKVVRNGNTPILMTWMINHQVLKTDVGEEAFKAPFVYVDDAVADDNDVESTPATQTRAERIANQKVESEVSDIQQDENTDKPQKPQETPKNTKNENAVQQLPKEIATPEARVQTSKLLNKQDIIDVLDNEGLLIRVRVKNPAIEHVDIYFDKKRNKWRADPVTKQGAEAVFPSDEEVKKLCDHFLPQDLQEYYTSGQFKKDNDRLLQYQESLVEQGKSIEERVKLLWKYNTSESAALRDKWGIYTFNAYTGEHNFIAQQDVRRLSDEELKEYNVTPKRGYTYILKDGKAVAIPNSAKILQGIPSSVRGEGTVDIEAAKEWLHKTLGIDPDDVMVTNAIMRAANAPQAYGLLQSVFDRIHNEFRARITLSTQSGRGVEYHEAWHYVSLLLLDSKTRDQIYSDYVKNNPQYKGATKQEVEEALAEEFRNYMLDHNDKRLSYRIKKFFRAVWNLVSKLAGRKLDLQSRAFEAIRKGKFKNVQLDQETLEEFNKATSEGIGFYAPGVSNEDQKQIPHITNANTLYNITESLGSTALAILDIKSMDDIKNLSLDDVFNTIQGMYDLGEYDDNENKKQIVADVLANKNLFGKQIREYLQELGIREIEREETKAAEEEARETGDTPDNIWDKASYEISKKANVSFNAKLFFYSIPQSRFTLDESGNQVVTTVKDNIFGLDIAQPFDITWNKILENLWESNSWDDLVSKVRNLAKADPFFATLLDRICDPLHLLPENTVTQLITTIQSAKNSMDTIEIVDSNTATNPSGGRGRFIWDVKDSSNLRKIARLPSQWSQNFLLSSLITTSGSNSMINKTQLSNLNRLSQDINRDIEKITKQLNNKNPQIRKNALEQFEQTKQKFLNLLNAIGIPFDSESLDYLIKNSNVDETENKEFITFRALLTRMPGNILNAVMRNINAISNSRSLEAGRGSTKISASRIFNYKDTNAVINLMAVAYGNVHPTPEEFSVTGADGSLLYPITQNNYMSDQLRWLNTNANGKLDNLARSPYSANSLIVKALTGKNKPKLKLHTLIAINENLTNSSRKYFEITPLEDYITKLVLIHKGRLILPTMSDKPTWYSISGINIPKDFLHSTRTVPNQEGGFTTVSAPRRFSDQTLEIFRNYFIDEYNAIVKYFDTKHLVEEGKHRFYDNYHGKIGPDGKMQPGGQGGRFRYFNQLPMFSKWFSLNDMLDKAERTGDDNMVKDVLDQIRTRLIEKQELLDNFINNLLLYKVNEEIEKAIELGVISRNEEGHLEFGNLPSTKAIDKDNLKDSVFNIYEDQFKSGSNSQAAQDDMIYSMIANFVTGYAISIEEVEKCFTGDPAFFKWKSDPSVGIYQRDVDKIKRLSSVLSTGTNLRTQWGANDARNSTKFTTAVMQDNMIGSDYYDRLREIFRADITRTMLKKNNPNLTDEELFDLTKDESIEKTIANRELLSEQDAKFIDKQADKAADPYKYDDGKNTGNINQADAAVYIRPAFYKRIMQSLGEWSPEIERAFNLLENDDILRDPDIYTKAMKAVIKPLKMVYFGDHFDNISGINIPVYNKMAIFPMFKILAKADNMALYDRMNNEELGTIDMMLFESAVKVGSTADKLKVYNDNRNTQLNMEAINAPSSTIVNYAQDSATERVNDGTPRLTTKVQDISQLRLQLNTDPEAETERSFGTQVVKIGFANVVDSRVYGQNKGLNITGEQIKKDIFGCIKALSSKGHQAVLDRFFNKDGSINQKALSDHLKKEARGTNMSAEVIEALSLGNSGNFRSPIAALSIRNWIESKIVSLINKDVIDIKTPGGSAIQMASFGFKKNQILTEDDVEAFNNGQKLSFDPDKGSMEVMLSANYFRDIVPKVFQKDFTTMRQWLMHHGIIGNNAQPYGVAYRVPTQGLSSTLAFVVADILPNQVGDVVVVPDEFTAMTGSDFDVDHLYMATYYYDGEGNRVQFDESKSYDEQDEKALVNKLLDSYVTVISDSKSMAQTRASIDTLTSILKKEILPLVQATELKEAEPMYELMPSFQEARKKEYSSGKSGIAPFALNTTNHCLTQAVHLKMKYSQRSAKYNLGDLDDIDSQDGYRILDWLSAMINAHVDVAKDPYILTLNVNQVTYNMANFLLRTGKGRATFLFLPQPILKDLVDVTIMNNGVIGVNKKTQKQIYEQIYDKYFNMLKDFGLSDSEYQEIVDLARHGDIQAFDESKLKHSLQAFRTKNISVEDVTQQLLVLRAYIDLSADAQVLSDLVQRSQIDTKKYGNSLSQLQNFYNSYSTFIEDYNKKFTAMKDGVMQENGLDVYFKDTFLDQKLKSAITLTNSILKNQVLPATDGFKEIFTSILQDIRGGNYDPINTGRSTLHRYNSTSDKEYIRNISNKIESIVRARVIASNTSLLPTDEQINSMLFGKESIAHQLNNIKNYIRQHKDDVSLMTFTDENGNITNDLLNYLQAITSRNKQNISYLQPATSSMNNSRHYEDRLRSAFYDLLHCEDPNVRQFAENLVKYAFLTSYDNRTPNSFFNLVPQSYREDSNYVDAMIDAITKFNTGDISQLDHYSIYLNLVRNYYKDNDIVPIVTRIQYKNGGTNVINYSTARNKKFIQVPTVLGLTGNYDLQRNYKFFKLVDPNNGNMEIYQRVGEIRTIDGQDVVERVYKIVPKLGFDAGSRSVYELYKEGNEQSAFDQNQFTEDMTRQVENAESKAEERVHNRGDQKYEFVRDDDQKSVNYTVYHNLDEEVSEFVNVTINDTDNSLTTSAENAEVLGENENDTDNLISYEDMNPGPEETFDLDDTVQTIIEETIGDDVIDDTLIEDTSDNTMVVKDADGGPINISEDQAVTKQTKSKQYSWSRYSKNNYEVSSGGDKRFSALNAKFKPGTVIDGVNVGGKTIEYVYQVVIKKSGKGKAPSKDSKLYNPRRVRSYNGNITPDANTIFVFGSNPEGRHGAGAAKIARVQFGAIYGQGEGLQGRAYALPTKDLRVKKNNSLRSISPKQIIESINKLYETARQHPDKQFKVAYRNTDKASLNGYTGFEMIDMFLQAGPIPNNIVFSKEWVDTGKFNLSKAELEDFSYYNGYLPLWQEWAKQNPDLIAELAEKAKGKTLTDKFAGTNVSQARALSDILNDRTDITKLAESGRKTNVDDVSMQVTKIISGGQTGMDQIGLQVGKSLGLQTGGTATPRFYTEAGINTNLRDEYGLEEISAENQRGMTGKQFYLPRTEQNVINSDGTVYFTSNPGSNTGGLKATRDFARQHGKPFIVNPTTEQLRTWLIENGIRTLNVAGSRGSRLTEAMKQSFSQVLRNALTQEDDVSNLAKLGKQRRKEC